MIFLFLLTGFVCFLAGFYVGVKDGAAIESGLAAELTAAKAELAALKAKLP